MLVHHKVSPPSISSGFVNNSPVPIYTPGWRDALWEESVLHKDTTQWPSQVLNPDPSTGVQYTVDQATVIPQAFMPGYLRFFGGNDIFKGLYCWFCVKEEEMNQKKSSNLQICDLQYYLKS